MRAGKVQRDRLLLALLAYGGLRRSELLGLDWDAPDPTQSASWALSLGDLDSL